MQVTKIRKNSMGTVSFEGRFASMRKPQEFVVYPVPSGVDASRMKIQSDTRIGYISMADGNVRLCKPIASGAYSQHLAFLVDHGCLTGEELVLLKAHVFATASGRAGSCGVVCDNSHALEIFSQESSQAA